MAGKQWFVYSADNGKQYAVMLSKNFANAGTKLGFQRLTNTTTPRLPQGMKMRYVNVVKTNGVGAGWMRRRLPVANLTAAIFTKDGPTQLTYAGSSYETTSKRGEKAQFATPFDTGI